MGKKRKISTKKNIEDKTNNPIYLICEKSQHNDTFHKKYIKELKEIYTKSNPNEFFETFKKILMKTMLYEEECENANRLLVFCSKFVTSFDAEISHELLLNTFSWLLQTLSETPLVRYRLCEFVNKILNSLGTEATLEDAICDGILKYMVERLKDISPNVRVQAILALHRLQMPECPNDIVIKSYLFHLNNDPSPKVRQAVISSIARTFHTIPQIIERLSDIDEKVRRHTYLQMSSYSVKMLKVRQRLSFLEQGLNDHSEMVKKVVVKIMLPQWFETYQKSFLSFISALKIDANETELERFISVSKSSLAELFKHILTLETILSELPIAQKIESNADKSDSDDDPDENDDVLIGDIDKIIPLNQLSIEMVIYWSSVIDFIQKDHPDEINRVLPELTAFCEYIACYCEANKIEMDKWEKDVHNSILLLLIKILSTYDLSDEIGRQNLFLLLKKLLCHYELEEQAIKTIVKMYEQLITDTDERFQYLIDIIRFISDLNMSLNLLNNDRQLFDAFIKNHPDKDIEIKFSTLKLTILDLREQETKYVEKKEYENAQKIAEKLIEYNEEFSNLLKPLLSNKTEEMRKSFSEICSQIPRKVTNETTIKCLQIAFYMIVSNEVRYITPNVCVLYKDFIRRNVESAHTLIREWSLRLATAISMQYEILAKDVFSELNAQFYKTYDTRIWKATIQCIFELLDRFGFKFFDIDEIQNKDKKKTRQLFNNTDYAEIEEEQQSQYANGTEIMLLMSHLLETCDEMCIIRAVVEGFSRLVLRGHYESNDIISKLLLKYFNPVTDNEVNQILGLLFEQIITKKKQDLLEPLLLPTLYTILEAPNESPLRDIKPQIVLKFVIDSTRPQFCSAGLNIHNTIAISFLNALLENKNNKNLIKLLSKELLKLEISDDPVLRNDLKVNTEKFIECVEDKKSIKDVFKFKDMLDGKLVTIEKENTVQSRNAESGAEDGENLIENHSQEASTVYKPNDEDNEIEISEHTVNENVNDGTNCNNDKTDEGEEVITTFGIANKKINQLREKPNKKSVTKSIANRLSGSSTEDEATIKTVEAVVHREEIPTADVPLTPNNNKQKTRIPYVKVTQLSNSVLRQHMNHNNANSVNVRSTRSATKKQFKENNVITRKRSLEKKFNLDNAGASVVRIKSSIPIRKNALASSKSGDFNKTMKYISSRFDYIEIIDDDTKSPPRSRSKRIATSPITTNIYSKNAIDDGKLVNKSNKNKMAYLSLTRSRIPRKIIVSV